MDLGSELEKCIRCGYCRLNCPVYSQLGWESYSPRGKLILALESLRNPGILGSRFSQIINTCTGCGFCQWICPPNSRPLDLITRFRRLVSDKGFPSQAQSHIPKLIRSFGNPYGSRKWIPKDGVESGERILFLGCTARCMLPELCSIAQKLASIFGLEILAREPCCGQILVSMGLDAESQIQQLISKLERCSLIVTICAGCLRMLRSQLRSQECLDLSQFLLEQYQSGKLELSKSEIKLGYHDPCHLGRHLGIYDPPRELISLCGEFIEIEDSRENSRCCGGGGGLRYLDPELSLRIAASRIEDFPGDLDYIVTSCSSCLLNLAQVDSKVIHLAELILKCLKV